jgi:hypothetical protein
MELIKQNAFDLGNPSFFDISGWSLQNPNFVATCGTIKKPQKGMDDEKGGTHLKPKQCRLFSPAHSPWSQSSNLRASLPLPL